MIRLLLRPPALLLAAALEGVQRLLLAWRGVLEVQLGPRRPRDPLAALPAFEAAATAPGIRAVLLRIDEPGWGAASVEAWCAALRRVRATGRKVIACLEAPANDAMRLAAEADRTWLHPAGHVALLGVAGRLLFFKGAMDRYGVRADLVAAGRYKAAGEPFTRTFPSIPSRANLEAVVEGLQDALVEALARGRGMAPEAVREAMARAPLLPEEARERGLVDAIGYAEDALEELEEDLGVKPRRVPGPRGLRFSGWVSRLRQVGTPHPCIAVVHLRGPVVVDGQGVGPRRIAAREVVPLLRELEEGDAAAVVLALDSPGGSALASETIWRAVERLARTRPVVAALGNVAASGGYYIACAASRIVARPSTLTGSIGVVGGKLVLGAALARHGIHAAELPASPRAAMFSVDRPFTPGERARFREGLAHVYDLFLDRVAAGRRLPRREVEALAEGRVWTGREAVERGLVDDLGGVDEALRIARLAAGIRATSSIHRRDYVLRGRRRLVERLLERSARAGTDLRRVAGWPEPLGTLLLHAPGEPLACPAWSLEPPPTGPRLAALVRSLGTGGYGPGGHTSW